MNNIAVENDRNDYNNKKIVSEIRIIVLRHIQNLNQVLINIKRLQITIFDEKF